MNKWSHSLIQAFIHSALWIVGIVIVVTVMNHSSSRIAYGYLIGWWLALYVGYIARFNLLSALMSSLIYIVVGVLSVWFGWEWFYKGLPESISFSYLVTLLLGAVVFCSPILINSVVKRVSDMVQKR